MQVPDAVGVTACTIRCFASAVNAAARSAETGAQVTAGQWVKIGRVRRHAPLKGDCDTSSASPKVFLTGMASEDMRR